MLSVPTCLYGRPFSPKTHAVRLAYNIKVVVVIAALPSTASAGVQPPLKIRSSSSTPNSERTILMDPYLRRGKDTCVAGTSATPPAVAKVKIDVTTQVMAAHVTVIIGDTTRHTKVTPKEYHAPTSLPMRAIFHND